jgi:FixJ family two-component response regulator
MKTELQQLSDVLGNLQVLIVEDDVKLATQLAGLIKEFAHREPVLVHTMEAARKMVAEEKERFGLLIMDVMLPESNQDFDDIGKFKKKLIILRKKIKEASTRPADQLSQEILENARRDRAHIQRRIEELIQDAGGIHLVEEWHKAGIQFPILFLTAVGAQEMIDWGKAAAGKYCEWITKPAPDEEILAKCKMLLNCR